jgi:hypothetical protein
MIPGCHSLLFILWPLLSSGPLGGFMNRSVLKLIIIRLNKEQLTSLLYGSKFILMYYHPLGPFIH